MPTVTARRIIIDPKVLKANIKKHEKILKDSGFKQEDSVPLVSGFPVEIPIDKQMFLNKLILRSEFLKMQSDVCKRISAVMDRKIEKIRQSGEMTSNDMREIERRIQNYVERINNSVSEKEKP